MRGAGRLRSCPNILIDAIIYGRDLKDDDDYVSEERFDKIRFYLEKGKYPPSADRSEKSRLRSAATHYRIVDGKLMLKDKEVVSDSQLQYEIAKSLHALTHGGINKTTANIAEKYHWVRIKETVSQVIRNCAECKEHGKVPGVRGAEGASASGAAEGAGGKSSKRSSPSKTPQQQQQPAPPPPPQQQQMMQPDQPDHQQISLQQHLEASPAPQQSQHLNVRATALAVAAGLDIPVDPQMMEGVEHHDSQQFVHSMVAYAAPVASMHPVGHHLGEHGIHAAAVEAARAALNEGGEELTDEDRNLKDRHLLEALNAELKRDGYGEDESG